MFEVFDKIIEGARKAKDVAQRIRDAELQGTIADLMLNLANLKVEMAEIRSEYLELRNRILEHDRHVSHRSVLDHRDGLYWAREAIPGYGMGPFCPACMDDKNKLIGLYPVEDSRGDVFRMDCKSCKTPFVLPQAKRS